MTRFNLVLRIIIIWLAFTSVALAKDSGFYLGGGNGGAVLNEKNYKNALAFKIFGGYQASRFFSVSTSTLYFDRFKVDDNEDFHVSVLGQSLEVAGYIPLPTIISLYAKAGALFWRVESKAFGERIGQNDGIDPYGGLGVKVQLPLKMEVRFEAERYLEVGGSNINLFQLNFGYMF